MDPNTDQHPVFHAHFALVALVVLLILLVGGAGLGLWLKYAQVFNAQGAASNYVRAVKIVVSENGIYELNAADMAAYGISPDISHVHLYLRNQIQPFWSEGQGKGLKIHFYGQASDSIYTKDNVYWLVQGDQVIGDLRDTPTSEPLSIPPLPLDNLSPQSYLAELKLEQNLLYNPQVEEGDHWLWASIPAPSSQNFEASLTELLTGAGRLLVMVLATTEAPTSPDHHLIISLNGQDVVDERWDGKGRHLIQADIPSGFLRAGQNTIGIQSPGDLGVAADITALDWIEIDYPRKYSAQDDRLEVVSPGGSADLVGFSGQTSIFDVTELKMAKQVSDGNDKSTVFNGEAGRRYWIIGPQGYRKPSHLAAPVLNPDLRAPGSGADYIAIGPPDLLAPLKPLLDWRAGQGYETAVVPLEAVFDQFNGGIPEPEAIQTFMKYARQNWHPAPRYLLLVGDATYDPRGYQSSPENNRLPVFFVNTVYGGQTASDVPFSQLDDDLKPELAVGRIPASKPQQVTTLIQKILTYEQDLAESGNGQNDWRQRVLAVSDGQDSTFRDDAQAFLDQFKGVKQTELYATEAGVQGASQRIHQYFDQGYFLIAYFGHGSINMWGKDRLFAADEVGTLPDTENLPIILTMTCLNGLFTHPKVESLAEALLWQENGGAVAVLAPTSLTLPTDQSLFSRALVQGMLSQSPARLGDALLNARQQMAVDTPDMRDVQETFLLFGDPALKIHE